MKSTIIIENDLDIGETLQVIRKKQSRGAFRMIGNTDMDFVLMLAKLSKTAGHSFEILNDKYDWKDNGKATIKYSSMTRAEQKRFNRGLKELTENHMIKKINNDVYIFNPDFIINKKYYETAKAIWETI